MNDRVNADVVCVASWNADLISRVQRPIARGETLMAADFNISPGGKGSNAAVAAARQGARVALIARIGDDDFGHMGMKLWEREGIVTTHVEQAAGERSGVAQILVYEDGDNSIAVYPGAGTGLTARHARAAQQMLAGCRVVMASCEVPAEATLEAFRLARDAGAITLLNPAPARPLSDELLALVDVLTPNESELCLLAGAAHAGSVDGAAQQLLSSGVRAVLVTLGAAGCRLFQTDKPPVSLPGRTMAVRDTIGAGDTFTGALAAALARGEMLPVAMQWANAAAALSVTQHGAIDGMPSSAETVTLLG
ncbi:MAG: ribokinase [Polaromonas sp.]|uniref:ribokinase n=1 Tax=Polaromonas sp. TaxID=1869339 RepID=UPI0032630BEE